ncbi:hypothetical protein TNCV_3249221 [Trichonephila clavipes]|nr:hypothetical protein TNCV_3249221 [Trichonephila clavipes]
MLPPPSVASKCVDFCCVGGMEFTFSPDEDSTKIPLSIESRLITEKNITVMSTTDASAIIDLSFISMELISTRHKKPKGRPTQRRKMSENSKKRWQEFPETEMK